MVPAEKAELLSLTALNTRKIFTRTSVLWLVIGLVLNLVLARPRTLALGTFGGTWFVAATDLLVTIFLVDRLTSKTVEGSFFSSTLFLGATKVACLALLGVVLWSGQSLPVLSVLSGLATLIVVPIVGGLQLQKR